MVWVGPREAADGGQNQCAALGASARVSVCALLVSAPLGHDRFENAQDALALCKGWRTLALALGNGRAFQDS